MTGKKQNAKVPVLLQTSERESGACSLAMILAYYGKWVSLERARLACGVSRDGVDVKALIEGAHSFSLTGTEEEKTPEELFDAGEYPLLFTARNDKMAVLTKLDDKYAYVNNPETGRVRMTREEFDTFYTGTCVRFVPEADFERGGKKRGLPDYIKAGLNGNGLAFAMVSTTLVLASAAGVLLPVFSRVYTDNILSRDCPSWYNGFILLLAGVIAFQLAASVMNMVIRKRVTGKLAAQSNSAFMWHILRLPLNFFLQRQAGDLAGRQASNDTVATTMIGQLAPTVMNLFMLIFYLFVMIKYSVVLSAVGICTIALNLFLARMISNKRREITRIQLRNQGNLDATTVSGIDMIDTIKAAGAENGYFERWSGEEAAVIKEEVRFAKVNMFLGTLPELMQNLSAIVILLMGLWSIMNNHFTVGLLLAFQSYMTAFMNPVNHLITAGQGIMEMRSAIERIDDVMEFPAEITGNEDDNIDLSGIDKLPGDIEMKDVCFSFSKSGPLLIDHFNLSLKQGSRVALVGGSGSGKSTIAKLITGLYTPTSGEILYNGKTIDEIPRVQFKSSISMVDQDVILFHDTVENNIKLWDSTIEDYEMILAARDADIHTDIVSRNGGYKRVIEEGGRDMSGGQRQRIEIARVLAGEPSVIIMDEATSALDARTEYDVSNYIRERGITCVIVAHRLSTIRDCDEIIVLEHGKECENGTDDELMKKNGIYCKLITTE